MSRIELSVAIMTHPDRLERALALRDRLRPDVEAEVVVDPEPEGPRVALRSARLAWAAAADGATHHLVLQDDVSPCASMIETLTRFINIDSPEALSLFANWWTDTSCLIRCAALLDLGKVPVVDVYIPTQALVVPVEVAATIGEWLERAEITEPEDGVILACLRQLNVRQMATVPCLVEHDASPSVSGNDTRGTRRAAAFSDSPVLTSTTAPLATPEVVPCFQRWSRRAGVRLFTITEQGAFAVAERPISVLFAKLGVPVEEITLAFERSISRPSSSGSPELLEEIGRDALREAYFLAAGIALCAAKHGGESPEKISARLGDRLVALALSTLVPGTAQLQLPIDDILANSEWLTEISLDGVATGLAIAHQCDDWPNLVDF